MRKTFIKSLLRLDNLIERFQEYLQGARVRIIEMAWDLKEKESKKQSKPQTLWSTKPGF